MLITCMTSSTFETDWKWKLCWQLFRAKQTRAQIAFQQTLTPVLQQYRIGKKKFVFVVKLCFSWQLSSFLVYFSVWAAVVSGGTATFSRTLSATASITCRTCAYICIYRKANFASKNMRLAKISHQALDLFYGWKHLSWGGKVWQFEMPTLL